ncbi:MAG: DUF296 domain-containing protein [Myxococcota bacterium]
MIVKETKKIRNFIGRLDRKDKLPAAFVKLCKKHNIKAGVISAIGALESVALGEYDQSKMKYVEPIKLDRASEIITLLGNISQKDGEPFVHLHLSVAYEVKGAGDERQTQILAGHLFDATVFACEFHIAAFDDVKLNRAVEPQTGLSLWMEPA